MATEHMTRVDTSTTRPTISATIATEAIVEGHHAARRSGAYKAIPITNVNDDEWLAFKSPDGFARTYEMPDGSMVVIQGLSAADEFYADNPDAELMQTTHHPSHRDRRAVTRKQARRYAPGTPQHVIDDFEIGW